MERGGTLDKMTKNSSPSRQKARRTTIKTAREKKGFLAAVSPSGIGVEKYVSRSHVSFPGKKCRKINAGHICHFFVLSCCVSRPQAKGEK